MQAVLGNPPFIRFHRFTGKPRALGRARATALDVDLSGLASSWAHFVVHACAFLDEQIGRLGLVLPAELLHADYAQPIRDFLVRRFESVTIVAFDKRAFHPALVDAVLLLCDRQGPRGLHIWRLTEASQLSKENLLGGSREMPHGARWSSGFHQLSARLYGELIDQERFCRLGSLASVDIGVVTGANSFFIISEGRRAMLGLDQRQLTPIIERGRDLLGLEVRQSEPKWLLDLAGNPDLAMEPVVAAYLAEGEKSGVPLGYKTSHRKQWWSVPTPRRRPQLLLPYMYSGSPRLIANPGEYWSSNLVHGLHLRPGAPHARALAAASLSAATAFSAEIEGRVYGGGVLKLEPGEAERILIPQLTAAESQTLQEEFESLDGQVRSGKRAEAARSVDNILGIDHQACAAAVRAFQERRRALGARK